MVLLSIASIASEMVASSWVPLNGSVALIVY